MTDMAVLDIYIVALLDISGVTPLVGAARLLDLPLTLLVDGYNECRVELREKLTRVIAAASRRFEASVVVTAQEPLVSPC